MRLLLNSSSFSICQEYYNNNFIDGVYLDKKIDNENDQFLVQNINNFASLIKPSDVCICELECENIHSIIQKSNAKMSNLFYTLQYNSANLSKIKSINSQKITTGLNDVKNPLHVLMSIKSGTNFIVISAANLIKNSIDPFNLVLDCKTITSNYNDTICEIIVKDVSDSYMVNEFAKIGTECCALLPSVLDSIL